MTNATAVLDPVRRGARIEATGIQITRGRQVVVDDVDVTIEPGELVAITGPSGAGKSSLLDVLAGLRAASRGEVSLGGVAARDLNRRHLVGFVPQDDVIHRDLPVRSTLRYAARLRLPASTPSHEIDAAVDDTLTRLGLADRADVRVGDLSGGQRKRVSIGVELLTAPRAFFLDEPTSGLDRSTAASLMALLRRLADDGAAVVLTTHNSDDLDHCDRTIRVEGGVVRATDSTAPRRYEPDASVPEGAPAPRAGRIAQWRVLTRRSLDTLMRNPLTLTIMLGAPAAVIAMFAMMFRPGALDARTADATAAVSTAYWLAFAAFFFGLTYGLLQICTELSILRRERFVGLRLGPYLAAKVTVLAPVLAVVNVAMLVVLRALDRLPSLSAAAYGRLVVTLVVTSVAALALGLLTSAAVADAAQATLALPMLCFPAVLFAGAVVPRSTMPFGGRAASALVEARWSFEAVGRELGLARLFASDHTGAGQAALVRYRDAFDHPSSGHWAVLAAFAIVCLVGGAAVARRRTR